MYEDYPDFNPNITPIEMFKIGIMGGSYFREIKSPKTGKIYKNHHKKIPYLKDIPNNKLINETYEKNMNYYKVKVGTSYEFWTEKNWINEDIDPYGWIEWYCHFHNGRRTDDDLRQIKRWKGISGENGRFRKQLQNKINEIGFNDKNVYIGMRQTLLHWGFDSRKMISIIKK